MALPGQVLHCGSVLADGLLFDEAIPMDLARQRIVHLWRPGARVFALPCGYILLWPTPLRVLAREALGAPLVRKGQSYFTAPAVESPASASIVRYVGGALETFPLPTNEEDPAGWLDLTGASLLQLVPLGDPPAPLTLSAPAPRTEREVHDVLGVAAPDERRSAVLQSLLGSRGTRSHDTQARATGAVSGGLLRGLLSCLLPRRRRTSGPAAAPLPEAAHSPWFRRLLLRLVTFTRMSRLVGKRHAAYLAQTVQMFEQGRLEEALRHAIPLGAMQKALQPAFGLPDPRSSLELSMGERATAWSIGLGVGPYEYLRRLYRGAFERLDHAGRVEDATFVLAELLGAHEEAVAYLERHGRLSLAAELAEARKLSAGLVVRQWFLAGDRRRALRIARERGAVFEAVTRLQSTHPAEAKAWRLVWADALAGAGDYAGAVDAAWPVADARRLALAWIDRAIGVGEAQAPRMLAKKVALVGDERWDEVAEQARALVDPRDTTVASARAEFLKSLALEKKSEATRALSRAVWRAALLADPQRVNLQSALAPRLLDELVDRDLSVDVPRSNPAAISPPESFELTLDDRGLAPVHDVAMLPSGRVLLALGEAGVRLVGVRGNVTHHFSEPASALVLSDHGDRALALARRGEIWRVAWLDLHERRSGHLADLRLQSFAPTYDGESWWIAQDGAVSAIELLDACLPCRFRVDDLGTVLTLERREGGVSFLAASDGLERFDYELPSFTLRRRTPLLLLTDTPGENATEGPVLPMLGARARPGFGTLVAQFEPKSAAVILCSYSETGRQEIRVEQALGPEFPPPRPEQIPLTTDGPLVALALPRNSGTQVVVCALPNLRVRARLDLPGAKRACLRLGEETLQIADDRGLAALVDLRLGAVRKRWVI